MPNLKPSCRDLSLTVTMKLELARSKVALNEQVAQREVAERLLRESIDANIEKTAQIKENMTALQAAKRAARWNNAEVQVLQKKYNNQAAELADLKRRLLEQHDKDSYTYDTRKNSQVQRRATEAREGCETAKKTVRRKQKEIQTALIKASKAEEKAASSALQLAVITAQLKEVKDKLKECNVDKNKL